MFVITGGGSGIGKTLAIELSNRGETVLVVGRNEDRLQSLTAEYSGIQYFQADLSTQEGLASLLAFCRNQPFLKGLVNNAGTIEPMAPLLDVDPLLWDKAMAINLKAPLVLTQHMYPMLQHGRVLNISSGAAYFAIEGWAAYCTSKAALSTLTRCWQAEYPDFAVASVLPGIVDTDMQALIRQTKGMSIDKQDFYKKLNKENKLISSETVASFLSWLLLDIDVNEFRSREWDLYESWHHSSWMKEGQSVPPLEEGQ